MERPENWRRGHSVAPPWPGPAWPPRAPLEAQALPPYHRLSAGSQLRHPPGALPHCGHICRVPAWFSDPAALMLSGVAARLEARPGASSFEAGEAPVTVSGGGQATPADFATSDAGG